MIASLPRPMLLCDQEVRANGDIRKRRQEFCIEGHERLMFAHSQFDELEWELASRLRVLR